MPNYSSYKDALEALNGDKSVRHAVDRLRLFVNAMRKDSKMWDKLIRSPVVYPALTLCSEIADTSDSEMLYRHSKRDIISYYEIARAMWSFLHLQELC